VDNILDRHGDGALPVYLMATFIPEGSTGLALSMCGPGEGRKVTTTGYQGSVNVWRGPGGQSEEINI